MRKTWLALAGTALALVLVAGTFDTAQAGRRGGFHFGGGKFVGGGRPFVARPFAGPRLYAGPRFYKGAHWAYHRPFKHRRHFRRHIFVGVPFAYGAYYYGYGSCRWLRIRALETGSRYWWARYYDCIGE
jgi:hypothetical protein